MSIKTVLVSGKFNILHPGHIRIFKFARQCGQRLIVAVESDRLSGAAAHIREEFRLDGVRNCTLVDEAFIFDEPITELIRRLRPDVVVKGKEHERNVNPELTALSAHHGQLLFSSGEFQFSSSELIRRELFETGHETFSLPRSFMSRHGITSTRLKELVEEVQKLRVLTLGDIIVDDYITCQPLGMSQEDPTLVVAPVETHRFLGGVGIVAAHAAGLGAASDLISVVGADTAALFAKRELQKSSVSAVLIEDLSRPTTVKERYRSHGKTLLRVSHLHQSAVSISIQERIIEEVRRLIESTDILIFSDFNYGVLPQPVVDSVITLAKKSGVLIAADSQSSSQLGDIGRFKEIDLLLPTEREARVSLQNREDGLVILAEQLRNKSKAKFIFLKMGGDGVLIHAPSEASNGWLTDQVEALNKLPRDVAGAGDSMLVVAALSMAAGGSIWEAASLASMAAAVQVSKIGNIPLSAQELTSIIGQARD